MFKNLARSRASAAAIVAGLMVMGTGAALAQTVFSAPDKAYKGRVSFAAAERGAPILAGGAVAVSGQDFRPGQTVTLLYGATPLAGALTADAEGKITGRIAVPADAAVGTHPIVVVTQGPYNAAVTELKVSPKVPLSGEAGYDILRAEVAKGLYQSAYSPKANAIFVSSAMGRPPVKQSELLKVDANTLKVVGRASPAAAPARKGPNGQTADGGLFAVYGVGVDDAKGTVWTTNSRQNTVAVYRQSDLGLVKQFDPGTVNHARDVVVDSTAGKAYVSATFQPEVVVFETAGPSVSKKIAVASKQRGGTFSAASLSFDQKAQRLYVVSNATNEVAVINTATDTVENVFPVPGARGSIGVSHDPQTGRIFVASQGSDNVVVLDKAGAVVADTPVGAGALNVVFEPVGRRAYVSARGAGTVAVLDAEGKIVANLGPAPLANHVSTDGKGGVFAVNKAGGSDDDAGNVVMRIKAKR